MRPPIDEYEVKPNRMIRLPANIEAWLIGKAQVKQQSVPTEIKQLLIERYQAEQKKRA